MIEQLAALSVAPSHLLLVAELEDRYGTSGTIGLALVERRPDVWLVNLLITSCRVISRGIGGIMISYILQSAHRGGLKVRAEFVAKLGTVVEEAEESVYWLDIVNRLQIVVDVEANDLFRESIELRAIFSRSLGTARANARSQRIAAAK